MIARMSSRFERAVEDSLKCTVYIYNKINNLFLRRVFLIKR